MSKTIKKPKGGWADYGKTSKLEYFLIFSGCALMAFHMCNGYSLFM